MKKQEPLWTRQRVLAWVKEFRDAITLQDWSIGVTYSDDRPKFVPKNTPSEVNGFCEIRSVMHKAARIWISPSGSRGETREVICHEVLHILFTDAGADPDIFEELEDSYRAFSIHQIIFSLGVILAKYYDRKK